MYSEQLEKLIELALADGELTEKEKQILFRRAEAEGIDLDEFEMVLEARLFEKTKNKTSQPVTALKSDKFGDVKKCPACGAIAETFTTRCPDCGHSFNNIVANASIHELFNLLNKVEEEERARKKSSIQSFFDGSININLTIAKRKASVISTFPIPNTKNDLLEFISQAVPNAKLTLNEQYNPFSMLGSSNDPDMIIKKAWRKKLKQIIMKARFSMKEDKKILEEIEHYAQQLRIK